MDGLGIKKGGMRSLILLLFLALVGCVTQAMLQRKSAERESRIHGTLVQRCDLSTPVYIPTNKPYFSPVRIECNDWDGNRLVMDFDRMGFLTESSTLHR